MDTAFHAPPIAQRGKLGLGLVLLMAPVALLWFCVEAGLTEEFLFRVLLQTRASAWLRSETAGTVVMALLFGLAHAPGYVLRGQHLIEGMEKAPDILTAGRLFYRGCLTNRADVRGTLEADSQSMAARFSSRLDRSAPKSVRLHQDLDFRILTFQSGTTLVLDWYHMVPQWRHNGTQMDS